MGIFSSISKTLFGDDGKAASKSQKKQNKADKAFIAERIAEARADILPLFGGAQESQRLGSQQALDVFGGAIPAQLDVFQQGNVGAQQAIAGGQDAFSRAIQGLPPLQQQAPQRLNVNTGFIPQNIQFSGNTSQALAPPPAPAANNFNLQNIQRFLSGSF